MTFLQIKYFLTVAKYKNFTKAAEALYVAQPAVTKQVMALERELDMKLFRRTSRSVELTPAGGVMKEAFERMSGIFEDAKGEAARLGGEDSRSFTVGILDGMYMRGFSDALAAFREKHRELRLNIWRGQSDFLKSELLSGRVDVILTYGNQISNASLLETQKLFTSEYFILMPKSHPLAQKGDELTREDIFGENFILSISDNEKNCYGHLKTVCTALGVDSEKIVVPPTFASIFSMVEGGVGIALVDMMTSIPNADSFFLKPTSIFHNFVAAWRKSASDPLTASLVSELKRAEFAQP